MVLEKKPTRAVVPARRRHRRKIKLRRDIVLGLVVGPLEFEVGESHGLALRQEALVGEGAAHLQRFTKARRGESPRPVPAPVRRRGAATGGSAARSVPPSP